MFVAHCRHAVARVLGGYTGAEIEVSEARRQLEHRDEAVGPGHARPEVVLHPQPVELAFVFGMALLELAVEVGIEATLLDRVDEEVVVDAHETVACTDILVGRTRLVVPRWYPLRDRQGEPHTRRH